MKSTRAKISSTKPAIGLAARERYLPKQTPAAVPPLLWLSVAATAMDYIFNVQNVIVVHHSFCGTTTYTPDLVIEEFRDHHHADISTMFDRESVAIMDYEKSLRYDVALLRSSPAVPKNIKLYGFFFDINSGKLTEVVRDIPA